MSQSTKRILLLIDSLVSGGAQRQLCMLGLGLKERGHEVAVLTYHQNNFYDYLLKDKVPIIRLPQHEKWKRTWLLRRAIRDHRPDAVIAFLQASCLYAELAALPFRSFKLIVGERNLDLNPAPFFRFKTLMHSIADAVVCNSYAQTDMIHRHAPWLRKKLHTIPNAIDLERFKPVDKEEYLSRDPNRFRLLTLGRFAPQKNGEMLLRGFAASLKQTDKDVTLDWYGNRFFENGKPGPRSGEYLKLQRLAEQLGIADKVILGDPVTEVEKLYPQYDAFVLASKHEGCPNVLVEAMACGLPVLASRVADNERIVQEGKSGLLFSASGFDDVFREVIYMSRLSTEERFLMGVNGGTKTSRMFAREKMVYAYLKLMEPI